MQKRYVALWFRHLLTDWLALRQPELKQVPLVLAAHEGNRIVITAANLLAEKQGIRPGMTAADAKAVAPDLKVLDELPGKAEKLLQTLGEWCIRYSPQVAIDLPDGLIIDVTGCTHLWGSEYDYLKEVVIRFIGRGFDVRGAMADTPGTAWAVARFGRDKPVIEPGRQAEALLNLPPAALRLDPLTLTRLQKLGFSRIRNFISIRRSALRRRFGPDFLLRLDQALGNEDEPLQFICPRPVYAEQLPCPEPVSTAKGIEIAIKHLLEKLCKRLQTEGKGLRTATLKCHRVDDKIVGADIGTNRPSHSISHLFKLFDLKITTIEPALGIELFTLEATKVEDLPPGQEKLWTPEGGLDDIRLTGLLDKLANRIGAKNIRRYLPQESYWPECSVRAADSLQQKPATTWRLDRPRPSLLLKKPERIEVTSLLPDNPPMFFVYKGEKHFIKKADDAERIEPEWWRHKKPHRDYYVVEDEQGRRYWLFRSGHYTDKGTQWYIHGFFA